MFCCASAVRHMFRSHLQPLSKFNRPCTPHAIAAFFCIDTSQFQQSGQTSRIHSSPVCTQSNSSYRRAYIPPQTIHPFVTARQGRGDSEPFPMVGNSRLLHKQSGRQGPPTQLAASSSDGKAVSTHSTMWTLPTVLTALRLVAIPGLMAAWFGGLPSRSLICTTIFVAASFTDFLYGYIARKMGMSSPFGAFLDPVADKLMVAAVLVLLCTEPLPCGPWAGNAYLVPILSCVIIGREIAMSALREWAAQLGGAAHKAVAVSAWGKWKTATQMVSLTLLLYASGGAAYPGAEVAAAAGMPLLGLATVLTMGSLADYVGALWKYMK